jgi:hypothetical protein
MASPYEGCTTDEQMLARTMELIESHPLSLETIRSVTVKCWTALWQTRIGEGETAIPLTEVDVPSIVVAYFFERLYARELSLQYPGEWRGNRSKEEKDLVYIPDLRFSTEIKTSGQLGTKIFGNASSSKKAANEALVQKTEKSGYYITVNFHGQALTLIRFGWIDADDWEAQKAVTGQASTLRSYVYKNKLVEITGEYRLRAPIALLRGVGGKASEIFAGEGVTTIEQLLNYEGENRQLLKLREQLNRLDYE